MSRLSASFIKIWLKLTRLCSGQGQMWRFRHSRANNSKVTHLIWPEFELIWHFMPVLVTCKFEDDWIKSEEDNLRATFSPLQVYGKIFHRSRGNNSKMNSPIDVLVTCKYEGDRIKNEVAIDRTFFPIISLWELIFRHSRASNSKVNTPIWPTYKLCRDFMLVLVTCKFDEDPIKIEDTIDRTRVKYGIFWHSRAGDSKVDSPFWLDF